MTEQITAKESTHAVSGPVPSFGNGWFGEVTSGDEAVTHQWEVTGDHLLKETCITRSITAEKIVWEARLERVRDTG